MTDEPSPLQLIVENWCRGLDANVDLIAFFIENSEEESVDMQAALGDVVGELQRQAMYLSEQYGIAVLIAEGDEDVEH